MKNARVHDQNNTIITAEEVKAGKYAKNLDFVDVEEEFRVTFVKSAKNGGNPYFRLYYSLQDYKNFSKEQKERYEILRSMRHYGESEWHKRWESNVSDFCIIEKTIKDSETKTYKRADAFYSKYDLCLEFQHSFIANDFQKRNEFYSKQGYDTIWLYDLTQHNAKEQFDGTVELVEDNARGFFRVVDEDNLSKYNIFIQVRDGTIYRVKKLYRKAIDNNLKSTIRYFEKFLKLDEISFIKAVKNFDKRVLCIEEKPLSIPELWKPEFGKMVVENVQNGDCIIVYGNGGKICKDKSAVNCIKFRYVVFSKKSGNYYVKNKKYYSLSAANYDAKKWGFLSSR